MNADIAQTAVDATWHCYHDIEIPPDNHKGMNNFRQNKNKWDFDPDLDPHINRRDVSEHLTKELQLVGYVKKPSQWAAQGGEAAPCPWGPWGLKLTTHYEGAAGENSTKESFIAKKKI